MKKRNDKKNTGRLLGEGRQGQQRADGLLVDLTERARVLEFPFALEVSEQVYNAVVKVPSETCIDDELMRDIEDVRLIIMLIAVGKAIEDMGQHFKPFSSVACFGLTFRHSYTERQEKFCLKAMMSTDINGQTKMIVLFDEAA